MLNAPEWKRKSVYVCTIVDIFSNFKFQWTRWLCCAPSATNVECSRLHSSVCEYVCVCVGFLLKWYNIDMFGTLGRCKHSLTHQHTHTYNSTQTHYIHSSISAALIPAHNALFPTTTHIISTTTLNPTAGDIFIHILWMFLLVLSLSLIVGRCCCRCCCCYCCLLLCLLLAVCLLQLAQCEFRAHKPKMYH